MGSHFQGRRNRIVVLVVFGVSVVAVCAVAVVGAKTLPALGFLADGVFAGGAPDCESYEFDPQAWADDKGDGREEEAAALSYCEVLVGMPRRDAAELLEVDPGFRRPAQRRWSIPAGWVNDGIGPGDGQILYVYFDPRNRVTEAGILYEPEWYFEGRAE